MGEPRVSEGRGGGGPDAEPALPEPPPLPGPPTPPEPPRNDDRRRYAAFAATSAGGAWITGTAGAPSHSEFAGIDSPFITIVSGRSRA